MLVVVGLAGILRRVVGERGLRAGGGKGMGIGMKDGRVRAWVLVFLSGGCRSLYMCVYECIKRKIPCGGDEGKDSC